MRQGIRRLLECCMETSAFDSVFRRSDEVNEYAFSIVDDPAVQGRSLFLFVNYMDGHALYVPPPPYNTLFLGGDQAIEYPWQKVIECDLFEKNRGISDLAKARLIGQYDGGMASQDAAFGQLVEGLKRRGICERALIIVTADHGEAFGERGPMEHGVSVYEDQVQVPMLIK